MKKEMINNNKAGALIIEGHVQGLSNTRSLGKAGVPVYVVDKNKCIASHSKYCNKFFKSPDYIKDEFVDFLIELAIREDIRGWVLIPSNDHAVYTISKFKNKLQEYYKIIVPSLDIIDNIYDKTKLLAIAKSIGFPVPITQLFTRVDEPIIAELKFPVITKGRNGLSFYKRIGKKALLAKTKEELRLQLKEIDDKYSIEGSFTQEFIPFDGTNKTISFTAFCIKGEVKAHWTGVKLREHPIQFGTATFTKSIYIAELYTQSLPLINKLNYTGVCEVEYLYDPRTNVYKLIEINPRTWLWVGLAKACGIDYAKMIYNYANNIPFDYPKTYDTEKFWINPLSDTAFALPAIINGKLKFATYLVSLFKGNKTNALFSKDDGKPALAYLFNLFTFLRTR